MEQMCTSYVSAIEEEENTITTSTTVQQYSRLQMKLQCMESLTPLDTCWIYQMEQEMQMEIEFDLAGTVCEHVKPKALTLTDNDPVVLSLCEKNYITNFNDD